MSPLELILKPLAAASDLVDGGGPFVFWIFICGTTLWTLVLERAWYFWRVLPRRS